MFKAGAAYLKVAAVFKARAAYQEVAAVFKALGGGGGVPGHLSLGGAFQCAACRGVSASADLPDCVVHWGGAAGRSPTGLLGSP